MIVGNPSYQLGNPFYLHSISFIGWFVECSQWGQNFSSIVHTNYEYLSTKILLQRIGHRTWVLVGRDCGHIIDDHLSLQRLCATVTKEVQPVKGSLTLPFYEFFAVVFFFLFVCATELEQWNLLFLMCHFALLWPKKSKQLVVNCDAFNLTQVKAIFNSFGVKQKATFGSKHAWQAYFVWSWISLFLQFEPWCLKPTDNLNHVCSEAKSRR